MKNLPINVFMAVLGVIFMAGAFIAEGLVAPFSGRGPVRPISKAGRVIIFVAGLSIFLAAIGIIPK